MTGCEHRCQWCTSRLFFKHVLQLVCGIVQWLWHEHSHLKCSFARIREQEKLNMRSKKIQETTILFYFLLRDDARDKSKWRERNKLGCLPCLFRGLARIDLTQHYAFYKSIVLKRYLANSCYKPKLPAKFGGGSWIRTSEGSAVRFTVWSLWPLGNPS